MPMFHNFRAARYTRAKPARVPPEADASPSPGTHGPLPSQSMDKRAQLGWHLLATTRALGLIAYRLYEIADQNAERAAMVAQFEFFFSSRRRHTRCGRDWSSDVCSSDLGLPSVPESATGRSAPSSPGATADLPV